jgi:hypothetical protein
MAHLTAYILPLVVVCAAGNAHAQSWGNFAGDSPEGAHVSIDAGDKPASLEVVPAGESQPVARCENYCDFWALPGRYTLYTRDHASGARHELGLRVKRSVRYSLQQGDDSARNAGLAVGITGSAAILIGLFMTMPLVLSNMCEDSNCTTDGERLAAEIGLGLALGGAVATPIGFTVFSHNRTKLIPVVERNYGASDSGPSVRLGVVGVNGGLGLGGLAVF